MNHDPNTETAPPFYKTAKHKNRYTSIGCILTVRILTNRPYLNKKLECLFRDSLYNHVNFPAVSQQTGRI